MMTGLPRWSSGERARWRVASIAAERPAEITAPIPLGQCGLCADLDQHVWSEMDAERIGAVTLRRSVCVCDRCGRCDAQVTQVDVDPG